MDLSVLRLFFILIVLDLTNSTKFSNNNNAVYTDQFVLHLDGPPDVAKELAAKYDFIYLDKIFDNYYHLKHRRKFKRSIQANHNVSTELFKEPFVNSLTNLQLKSRSKRDLLIKPSSFNIRQSFLERFNDPKWSQMWYLNRGVGLDMNVQRAWDKNITGKGVVVTILDDGLEGDHPDLIENYDPKASFDVNNSDDDPTPRYDLMDSNRHGTRCAGEVAAMANNNQCAVGVAYHAKVGGVRMLDGDVTDGVEARSISFASDHIDIYSASWGPDDDGKTVDGPGELATRAFIEGVNKGRHGLGSIFIWASGNGGREHDNCNCDGYTNSIWTLSVSSATENGQVPWYSEACSSTLATTYSSGSFGEKQIVTTDLHHGCTITHTGTSASAPLAAAIAALALEANPRLTWRDMQHIVVMTSKPANLKAPDWKTNSVGRKVSHSFGYGLMDAAAMVDVSKAWVTVPEQKICEVRSNLNDKLIPSKSHIEMSLTVRCENVRYLEHVQAKVNLSSTRRGDIHIYLTSPSGTRSTLLAQRPMDNSHSGFSDWPFMTVHSWGESPNGVWKLEVHNEGKYPYNRAFLKGWTMVMFGTSVNPDRRTNKQTKSSSPISKANNTQNILTDFVARGPTEIQLDLDGANGTHKSINPPLIVNTLEEESVGNSVTNIRDDSKGQFSHRTREYNPKNPLTLQSADVNVGCRTKDVNSRCLDCLPGLVLFKETCVTDCPDGYYKEQITIPNSSTASLVCFDCHYTCKSCSGPNETNCTSCHDDAQINRHGHCDSKDLIIQIISMERYYTTVTVVFLCLCLLSTILLIYIITERNPQLLSCNCYCHNDSRTRQTTRFYDGFTPQEEPRPTSNFLRLKSIKRLDNSYSHLSEEEN